MDYARFVFSLRTTNMEARMTRSQTRELALRIFSSTVPILVQQGWIGVTELARLETTCRAGKEWINDNLWKVLALRKWPNVETVSMKIPRERSKK
jgi:hypothetical protein